MNKLTPKQQRFVNEYLVDLNATQAAIRSGYSPKTANEQGARLVANVSVKAAIQAAIKAREARIEITQDKVMDDIECIKQDAMRQVADKDGNMGMANHAAALKAAELQGKHLGMFREKIEHMGNDGGPILMGAVTADQVAEAVKNVRDKF